jgi:hypothetical protein
MSPHHTDPDRWVVAAPLSTDPHRRSLPRGGRGSPGPGRPRERRAMTLRWTSPARIKCSLFLMRNDLANREETLPRPTWASPKVPQLGPPPVEFSSAACSMQRRPLTASSVRPWLLTPPILPEGDRGPRMASGSTSSRGTRDRSCSEIPGPRTQGPRAERPLAAARGSICPLCSTWNPSPGVPQPGRGL